MVEQAVPDEPRDGGRPEGVPERTFGQAVWADVRGYFLDEDPTFWVAMAPFLLLSAVLYTRSLTTNFIFDEQEALLANPYVNGKGLGLLEAIHRDFWGLAVDRSVGSYRPIPDVVWRLIASSMRGAHDLAARVVKLSPFALNPWFFHWFNVILHAVNGALLTTIVGRLTQRRGLAWLAGTIFVGCAVLTEAVSGVVGIADVLGGLGALLALAALRLPLGAMPFAVFGAMLLGLFSKESALVCVPLVPAAALLFAPLTHPGRPLRVLRSLLSAIGAVAAFVLYVELRKRWFPSALPSELTRPLAPDAGALSKAARAFLVWFHQPALPKDRLNNPLIDADMPHRIAGALRVYFRGLAQIVLPRTLSGDYSFPQEPVPERVWFGESVLGGLTMALPPLVAVGIWIRSMRAELRGQRPVLGPLVALGLVWVVVSYFPHSNIPVLLPTVRAERFWYFPAIGSTLVLASFFVWLHDRTRGPAAPGRFQPWRAGVLAPALFGLFFTFQCVKARLHAFDYTDDLVFWRATKDAVPYSAKAHLNYSVMWGARGHLDVRLEENRVALALAPQWPMANIYLGDTLCRLHRAEEAWPFYKSGFELADNDPNLIALALQCMWDEGVIEPHKDELSDQADQHPSSWLAYLATDILSNGQEHGGVDPKYRPRGYNEGPKE